MPGLHLGCFLSHTQPSENGVYQVCLEQRASQEGSSDDTGIEGELVRKTGICMEYHTITLVFQLCCSLSSQMKRRGNEEMARQLGIPTDILKDLRDHPQTHFGWLTTIGNS